MSDAVITSYTLVDFPTESDMTAFFVFVEQNYEQLANDLRDNGMVKFYISYKTHTGSLAWLEASVIQDNARSRQ